MAEIINLQEIFRKIDESMVPEQREELRPYLTSQRQNIGQLLKGAMLDPDDKTRARLAKTLNSVFKGCLQRGFMADGQLYVVLGSVNPEKNRLISGTYCVCDMPKTYLGSPSRPHRFNRKTQ